MCQNKLLKDKLQTLSQSVFSTYEDILIDENDLFHEYQLFASISKKENEIEETPDFFECVKLMERDPKINNLLGQVVGISTGQSTVRAKKCIHEFIKELYLEERVYKQQIFDKKYFLFEELFYGDYVNLKDTSKLYNFSYEGDEISLGQGVIITRDKMVKDPIEMFFIGKHSPSSMFFSSEFILERYYKRKKVFGEFHSNDKEKLTSDLNENKDLFNRVITSLRILKPSAVYRGPSIDTEWITFHPLNTSINRGQFFDNVVQGQPCSVVSNDIDNLREIFDFIGNESNGRFKVATRRLSFGIEREKPEDQLIDFIIGFEALFLPEYGEDKSLLIRKRVKSILNSEVDGLEVDIEDLINRMYKLRNEIVHGICFKKLSSNNVDRIHKLESLLRTSINLWIKNKGIFSKNNLLKL